MGFILAKCIGNIVFYATPQVQMRTPEGSLQSRDYRLNETHAVLSSWAP
jgi:hypothetical protein